MVPGRNPPAPGREAPVPLTTPPALPRNVMSAARKKSRLRRLAAVLAAFAALVLAAAALRGLALLWNRGREIPVLMYHNVLDADNLSVWQVSADEFARQMDELKAAGSRPTSTPRPSMFSSASRTGFSPTPRPAPRPGRASWPAATPRASSRPKSCRPG